MNQLDTDSALLVVSAAGTNHPIHALLEQTTLGPITRIEPHDAVPDPDLHAACLVVGFGAGVNLLASMHTRGTELPVVVVSDRPTPERFRAALHRGAAGYFSLEEMTPRVFECSFRRAVERHRLERELKEREMRHRVALAASGLGTWECDAMSDDCRWDPRMRELLGVEADGPIPEDVWFALCHPDDEPGDEVAFTQLLEPAPVGDHDIEVRVVRSDGQLRWLRCHRETQYVGEGEFRRVRRIIGTAEDITDTRRERETNRLLAETGLSFAESLDVASTLRSVAEAAVESLADICVIDLVGPTGKPGRVEVATRDPDDAPLAEWLRSNPLFERTDTAFAQVLSSGNAVTIPRVAPETVKQHGVTGEALQFLEERSPVSVMTTPMNGLHTALGAIMFISLGQGSYGDSDLAVAEELSRRAALSVENALLHQQATEALSARDELQRIVAHDLRSPLNAMSLSAGFVAKLVGADPRPVLHQALANQRRAIASMEGLIDDLLWTARLESGPLPIELVPLDLAEVVDDVLSLYMLRSKERDVALSAKIAPSLPLAAGDHARLRQVLGNLVGNALHFTPAGGSVEVEADREGDALCVWVRDTGPGISESEQARIFDRYWQESAGAGVGLGLWIAKSLVELHGGEISVSSVPGEGAAFRFTVPCADEVLEGA